MSYKNLINEVLVAGTDSAKQAEAFMRFRDFVCARNATFDYSATGIGWTLHDSSYAVDEDNAQINDWFVLHSTGETGRDKMYFWVQLVSNYIRIRGWQYWDSATHAGSGTNYYRDNAWLIGPNPVALYIYGDMDFVAPIIAGVNSTTNWSHGNFGCLDDSWLVPLEGMGIPRNVQVCSSALSAGSDVSIVVPDSSSKLWTPDCHLFIMDDASIERILVKTNNGSTTLTADLTNSYSAGARIAVVFPYYAPYWYGYYWPGRGGYNATLHDLSGNLGPLTMTYSSVLNSGSFNMLDGNGYWGNLQVAGPKFIYRNATGEGPLGHIPNCYEMYDTTGLTHEDLLDDVTDPAVKWRYCDTHTPRVYKEV